MTACHPAQSSRHAQAAARQTVGTRCLFHFLTVKGAEYSAPSQDILINPPPEEFFCTAMVNWSTEEAVDALVRSTRVRSLLVSTGTPHWPIFLLIASLDVPDSSGII